MKRLECGHPDIALLEPTVFGDHRGFVYESWNARQFAKLGLEMAFVQDNHSKSAKNILRGLHYQLKHPQGKLVRAISGSVFDVAVDLRRGSPRFGQWIGTELSASNKHMLWVPPGFAHGFLSLEDDTQLVYKCTDFYDPANERSIIWNDPDIGIEWPDLGEKPQLSDKDAHGTLFATADVYP